MTTVHEDLRNQMAYDNIKAWHDKGIAGKGITIWNMENDSAQHGQMTTIRVKHSAPDSEVINASLSMSFDNKEVKYSQATLSDGTKIDTEEFIKTRNIKLLTRSVGDGFATGKADSAFWNHLKEKYNLIIFNSAGNDGSNTKELYKDVAIRVGACGLNKYGKPQRDNYSAVGDIDFIDFRGFYSGTSFATPYLCGKAALLVQKYGHGITQEEVYEYFKAHAEDLDTEGKDNYTGWGLPIMGDPKTTIKMQIGNKTMDVDGRKITLDQEPIIQNSRTLVPVRAISEAFGAEVGWDDKTRTVTIER